MNLDFQYLFTSFDGRINRAKYWVGTIILAVISVVLGFLIGMPLVQAAMYGPLAAFISEMFATGNRYTGASLGYQLSTTLGGGFAPLIAASLVAGAATGNGLLRVALFTAGSCLLSALVVTLAKETSGRDLTAVS